jgi:hypothetical protein
LVRGRVFKEEGSGTGRGKGRFVIVKEAINLGRSRQFGI